jgi:hypothetical protein
MENTKFKLLILEDKELYWDKINDYLKRDYDIYDKTASLKTTSFYCAYKTADAQYITKCKTNLEDYFNPILNSFADDSLICIIDINWNGDDKFGIDFYREYLSQSNKIKGVIITTVGNAKKLQNELGCFENAISKKDDYNHHYLTPKVLGRYKNCIDKIIKRKNAD